MALNIREGSKFIGLYGLPDLDYNNQFIRKILEIK